MEGPDAESWVAVLGVQFLVVTPAVSEVLVTGGVIDENGSPVAGARVTVRPAASSAGGSVPFRQSC
jgi:hypothetical protein